MNEELYRNHLSILKDELVVAMGCTEPIAIAFAGAKAREVLGCMPERCHVKCSGNIVKNVKGVTVPTSGGLRGIEVAATLGIVGGDASKELAVLQSVTKDDLALAKKLLGEKFCTCELIEGVENLYIIIEVEAGTQRAVVEIKEHHANITRIEKNGELLYEKQEEVRQKTDSGAQDRAKLNVKNILEFADALRIPDVEPILRRQIDCNLAIAEEGLAGNWGASVGKTLLERGGAQAPAMLRARAYAAAGSDARMGGCALPVVINSGSGNQGLTITLPLIVYAKEYKASEELLMRALAVANLLSVHQKKYIGSLSAYCGATSAACASACGIAYMKYKGKVDDAKLYDLIAATITNTICTVGGMVCDGAKSSCAAKIAVAVETALTGLEMSEKERVFQPGEGLTMDNVENTISAVGEMGGVGMKYTDIEILNIMLSC